MMSLCRGELLYGSKDLKDFMRQAGEVTYADAHKQKKNEGVVEFASYSDMKTAIEKLNNSELNGRCIKLSEDKSQNKRSRSRSRSPSRSRSHSKSRSKSRSPSHSRSRSKSPSRSRSKSPENRSRSRSKSQERSRSRSKSPSKSPSPQASPAVDNPEMSPETMDKE